jgi:recombination protein RecA
LINDGARADSIQATCHGARVAARTRATGPAATEAIANIHLVAVDIRRRDGRRERKRTSSWLDDKERAKAIDAALAQIDKQFGKGSIMRLGTATRWTCPPSPPALSLSTPPSASAGVPRGRVIEIFGPESSGKTTLSLHVIAEAQRRGGMAAFIDAEHALDAIYAAKLGVDTDNLLVSQPDSGEQALEIAEVLIRSGAVDVLVVDSVAALVPRAELEGEMGDAQMGMQARLMSQALRKLTSIVSKSKTCLIFINQLREKIGVMFGNPETTTGGRALKFYASMRLDIRRIASLKEGDVVIGSRAKVKVVKNKVAAPFREPSSTSSTAKGISKEGDLLDLGVDHKVIEKSGSWYAVDGERIGQGRETARQFLKDNPDIRNEIDSRLRKGLGLPMPDAHRREAQGREGGRAAHAHAGEEEGLTSFGRDEGGPSGPPFSFSVEQPLDRTGAAAL